MPDIPLIAPFEEKDFPPLPPIRWEGTIKVIMIVGCVLLAIALASPILISVYDAYRNPSPESMKTMREWGFAGITFFTVTFFSLLNRLIGGVK